MKRVRTLSVLVLLILAMAVPLAMAAKPADKGFDEFGYNYQARLFVGPADGVDRDLDGTFWGDSLYANDHLVMKWSKGWDDARFYGEPWGPDAWETNEWNGMVPGGSGEVWHYKIIWVGARWDITGVWDLNFVFEGNYPHEMTVTAFDPLTMEFLGYGHYKTDSGYTWDVSGTVSSSSISFTIIYTGKNAGYEVEAEGLLDKDSMLGTWTSNSGQSGSWSGSGDAQDGPYWREGGDLIWGQFEVIMSHGTVGGEHIWETQVSPNGFGGPYK